MSIRRILEKPHPFIFNMYSVLIPSLITFLVLVILKPFEFGVFSVTQRLTWSLLFAAVVAGSVLACVLAVKGYFGKKVEETWTIIKEIYLILFVLVVISLVLYILFIMLNPGLDRFELFGLVVLRTLAISFFPILILVLYEQNHHQKLKRKQAERLNNELLKSNSSIPPKEPRAAMPEKVDLVAINDKVALRIDYINICFVKSEGNYVEVFYHHNQSLQKELIRNSLKAIEAQLSHINFFRCHNRFLVNLHHIRKVQGNARSIELILNHVEEKIPVSRGKSDTLLNLFQQQAW